MPFDIVEVLILEDLRWTQVLVEDRFADLDVLARFGVGFPSKVLLVNDDVVAEDVVVHLRSS